jgi:tetratricopeptide (TPR) repeat protein
MTSGRLVLVLALLAPLGARAEEPDAKELYKTATAHFNLGRFKEAAEEYGQVYELHPDAVLLYNIAQSWRLAGGFEDKALFFYKSYLNAMPKAPNRAEVEGRIEALERVIEERKKTREQPPNEAKPLARKAAPSSVTAPAPGGAIGVTTSAPPPRRKPVYKQWWLWTAVGVAAAGVGLGLGLGLTLGQPAPFAPNLPDGGPGAALTF